MFARVDTRVNATSWKGLCSLVTRLMNKTAHWVLRKKLIGDKDSYPGQIFHLFLKIAEKFTKLGKYTNKIDDKLISTDCSAFEGKRSANRIIIGNGFFSTVKRPMIQHFLF